MIVPIVEATPIELLRVQRALVIGCGKAGQRFIKALTHLGLADVVELGGVCDIDVATLARATPPVRSFSSVSEALQAEPWDVVVVAANERAHSEILSVIARQSYRPVVLCEKPLTETLDQFEELQGAISQMNLAVNFVERYSSIVSSYLEWAERTGFRATRAEYFWGKYRYRDTRPTMGVLSELSHPLDLVRLLTHHSDIEDPTIEQVHMSSSDFTRSGRPTPDTINLVYRSAGGVLVRGHSSFLWAARRREISIWGIAADGRLHLAQLTFDRPKWDFDHLVIWGINDEGERSVVIDEQRDDTDFPGGLERIGKLARFVEDGLGRTRGEAWSPLAATFVDARWVQRTLHRIEKASPSQTIHDLRKSVDSLA